RKTACQLPVVLYVIAHVRVRQVWRKRSGLDCIAGRVSEKQVGQSIKAGGGRDRHGSAELAGERIRSVGLAPLYGGHPLELNRQARFHCVRAANKGEVIDNLG